MMKVRCPRCGSNFKPTCKGCEWNVAEINQRWVERIGKENKEFAVKQLSYRQNQTIRHAVLTFDDSHYIEGTDF